MKEVETMLDRISINENIYHGRACIKGTRIPVHQILQMLANGDTINDLLKTYPSITKEDLLSCLAFAAKLTDRKMKKTKFEKVRLKEAIAISDPTKRAEALREFATSNKISNLAFLELGKCGEAALPILRELKNDSSMKKNTLVILRTYGDIGGNEAGAEIASMISKDLEYWKGIAPELKTEWFNQADVKFNLDLSNRYTILTHMVRILDITKYGKCREVVGEVKDLWQSAKIDEIVRSRFMTGICDSILNPFDKNSSKSVVTVTTGRAGGKTTNKLEE